MMVTAHVLSGPTESCRSWEDCTWHLADKEVEGKGGVSAVWEASAWSGLAWPCGAVALGKGTGGSCRSFRQGRWKTDTSDLS